MDMNKILTSKNIAKHKRRFDRGGIYMNYLSGLGMVTIIIKTFHINSWWMYMIGGIAIIGFRYISGYLDQKKNILSQEQKGFSEENPVLMNITKQLEEIKQTLKIL